MTQKRINVISHTFYEIFNDNSWRLNTRQLGISYDAVMQAEIGVWIGNTFYRNTIESLKQAMSEINDQRL